MNDRNETGRLVGCDWSECDSGGWKNVNPALLLLQVTQTRYLLDICLRSAQSAAIWTFL